MTSRWMARMRISRTGRTVLSPPVRAGLHGACALRHTANSPLTGERLAVRARSVLGGLHHEYLLAPA